ncbi:tRNA(1)(Val) (adenine(37)-N(6))-methyltransferase [Saliniradius amylolyticus]|uniref:tRNA1(Val) (adenine(37)-N6)-methyltransferase n=1 Tax=Saliniradius amylolyticus TaxID=2183582 RepID=A0A2S2E145_9ALTE|nr:methyltransferase [Saliniradius amylolyticus]AWL11000.1 tRNA(1)(Val) (adenine(37)-N(6))-methyltransferase [Saliniradius amylolyticus]
MAGFQFKQFHVAHDRCAMKVGTDSIALGSWVRVGSARRILDVGCGSGLLALMLAQKASAGAFIEGIDIDLPAIAQARDNGAASPWSQQIAFYQSPVQSWRPTKSYDLIVTNPPYFPAGQSFEARRQQARHQGSLNLSELMASVAQLLARDGTFWVVLPHTQQSELAQAAKDWRLCCYQQLRLRAQPHKPVSLVASAWGWQDTPFSSKTLVIRDNDNQYTAAFRRLCRHYYLKF